MSDFRDKVRARRAGLLTYGLTPPRAAYEPAKLTDRPAPASLVAFARRELTAYAVV